MTVHATVSSGETSTGLVLGNGDFVEVLSGGTAVATVVNSGGDAIVDFGGILVSTTVNSGGLQEGHGTLGKMLRLCL